MNYDVLTATTTIYNHEGIITGFEVMKVNLSPIDAILGVVICIIIITFVLFKKI